MKFYYIPNHDLYFATLSDASAEAREKAKQSYIDVEVEQVDVGTNKDDILRMLNDRGYSHNVVGTVYVTRGRMKGKAR